MLKAQSIGQGPTIVMLHGFGLHSGIWQGFAEQLAEHFHVLQIDLPGYGQNWEHTFPNTLEALAQQIHAATPAGATWIGWSLGGLLATYISAQYPGHVSTLIPIASNLQFKRTNAWPHAISEEILASFADNLATNFKQTLQRFIRLNCFNSSHARTQMRSLSAALLEPMPTASTLKAGLEILLETQLQNLLPQISCPIYYILGEQDQLVPKTLKEAILVQHPHVNIDIIAKAGHAPFLSHAMEVTENIIRFHHELQ